MSILVDEAVEAMRRANPVPDPLSLRDEFHTARVFPAFTKETQHTMETKQQTPAGPTDRQPRRRKSVAIVAAAFVAVLVVGGVVALVNDQNQPSASSQEDAAVAVILLHEQYRNAGDVDALIALYADDAVAMNHPLDLDETAQGVKEIRAWEQRVPKIHGENGFTEYRSFETSGNVVTFNQKFVNDEGTCFSDLGITVTVIDGKITLWVFAPNDGSHDETCD